MAILWSGFMSEFPILQSPRAVDPVCGMQVDPARAAGSVEHNGKKYYFCSKGCLAKFEADPRKYLGGPVEPHAHPGVTEYTCPMHPEIVRPGPGSCPICGMALEPVTATAGQGENPELIDMILSWIGLEL